MTACVNNQNEVKGGVSHKVLRSVVAGVLAVSMVPTAAMADEGTEAAGVDLLATDGEAWNSATVEFNIDPVNKQYVVESGEAFAVERIIDVHGNEIDSSDYTVLYFGQAGKLTGPAQTNGSSIDQRPGGMPSDTDGSNGRVYKMAIVEGSVDASRLVAGADISTVLAGLTYRVQEFKVVAPTTALSDVYAFESKDETTPADSDLTQLADTTFQYTGGQVNVSLAMGKSVLDSSDVAVKWTALPVGVAAPTLDSDGVINIAAAKAGTYTAEITPAAGSAYSGSATVSFEIKGIDLSTDSIAIAPMEAAGATGVMVDGVLKNHYITVNGVALDDSADVVATLVTKQGNAATGTETDMTTAGKYEFELVAKSGSSNVSGSKNATAYSVTNIVAYAYGTTDLNSDSDLVCNPELNQAFNPSKLVAKADGNEVGYTWAVYDSEGNKVDSWNTPGEKYRVVLDTPVADAYAYAGHLEFHFTNEEPKKVYEGTKAMFVSIDGKNFVSGSTVFYDGEAIVPTITVKSGVDKLVEGEDYEITVELAGKEVSEIKDPGTYTVTATLNDTDETKVSSTIIVSKANIALVEAADSFFPVGADGTAATPSFIGYTNADKAKAQKFDLAADDISVTYKQVTDYTDANKNGKLDADEIVSATTKDVKADELTEGGYYLASVNVKTTAKYLMGSDSDVIVLVSERVAFADVDANAWYAESVYQAAELGYVNGIGGTNLFAPTADIDRAQIAAIMFNMAGGVSDPDKDYPTKFSDVDASAWYAQAVSWASTAGVVNGYDEDTFGTFDKATREQVAAMFYNYAKAMGQDVTVEDEAAALAKVSDADTVSGWAKTAVAWAIENGVMGNGGYIAAQDNITRAEVAAMAVNFQPEKL